MKKIYLLNTYLYYEKKKFNLDAGRSSNSLQYEHDASIVY